MQRGATLARLHWRQSCRTQQTRDNMERIKLGQAWRIVGAVPVNLNWAWCAWTPARDRLIFTLPLDDIRAQPDGETLIDLYRDDWPDDRSAGLPHQWRCLSEATAARVPLWGFVVVQAKLDKVVDTFPHRLHRLDIVSDTGNRATRNACVVARIRPFGLEPEFRLDPRCPSLPVIVQKENPKPCAPR